MVSLLRNLTWSPPFTLRLPDASSGVATQRTSNWEIQLTISSQWVEPRSSTFGPLMPQMVRFSPNWSTLAHTFATIHAWCLANLLRNSYLQVLKVVTSAASKLKIKSWYSLKMFAPKASNAFKQLLMTKYVLAVEMARLYCSTLIRTSVKLSSRHLFLAVLIHSQHPSMASKFWPQLIKVSSTVWEWVISQRCYFVKTTLKQLLTPISCLVCLTNSLLAPRTVLFVSGTQTIIQWSQDAQSSLKLEFSLCALFSLMKLSFQVGLTEESALSRLKVRALFGRLTTHTRTVLQPSVWVTIINSFAQVDSRVRSEFGR